MKTLLMKSSVLLVMLTLIMTNANAQTDKDFIGNWKYSGTSGKGEIELLPDSVFNIKARMTRSFDGGFHVDATVDVTGMGMWSVEDSVIERFIDVESLDIKIINVNVPGIDPDLVSRGLYEIKAQAMDPVKTWLKEHPEVLTSHETIKTFTAEEITTEEWRDGDLEKTTYKREKSKKKE